ncbi:MAG: excinuclease ABC subunit UvrA, partial [Planctomycetota bacterium]|nr:excinuclease ABC subunit UvrA [Planctomycetota bacterium]
RVHNLKNITLRIPHRTLTVITGLSGSGKSSLAFDTIYVEGQRRYMESLSAYARQFLDVMEKPDVEQITGLPPTIAIEQRKAAANPRSTVATITEIYDYLRLLFARAGEPHCWQCGRAIRRQTPQQIVDHIAALGEGKRIMILAPLVRGRKGEHREILDSLRRQGYVRARIDGVVQEVRELTSVSAKNRKHTIEAVVDRIINKSEARQRLTEAVEAALRLAGGLITVMVEGEGESAEHIYSENFACPECNLSLAEIEPRMFSFNSPYGACQTCDGLGTKLELDPELLIPDPQRSLADGAIAAFRKAGKRMAVYYHWWLREVARDYDIDLTVPVARLPKAKLRLLLYGDPEGKAGPGFEGVIPNLERRFHSTDSDFVKQQIHEFMSLQPCPACRGARLRPEALAVRLGGLNIREFTALTVAKACQWLHDLALEGERAKIAAPILKEIRHRLQFLADVGLDYLTLDRTAGTLAGGEAQRIRLASQVGSGLVGVCYVLDEPTIGLHPRDNRRLLHTLEKLRDLGNTVIVVEHDEEVIRAADFLVDLGPAAGSQGGRVVACGSVAEVAACAESITGAYLAGRERIPVPQPRRPVRTEEALRLEGARANNLKHITVTFPLGVLVCVTGVSGSGKSTLVTETLAKALARALHGAREKPAAFDRLHGLERVDKAIEID